jgi:hypothetical protein
MPSRTSIEWALANPVLTEGACAYESDTGKWKLGNGTDKYMDLHYQSEVGVAGKDGKDGAVGPSGVNGQPGAPCFLTIGTVTSGTTASATITGTPPNQVLNLVLPVSSSSGGTGTGTGTVGGTSIRFVTQPEDESVMDGDAVVFNAEATQSAGALVSYKWQSLPANTSDQTKWADLAAPPTSSLRITADVTLNGRSYRCIATAGSLSVTSGTAMLFVAPQTADAVQFDSQPFDSSIPAGGTAIFRTTVTITTGAKVAVSRVAWKWQGSAPASGGGWDPSSWVDINGASGNQNGFTASAVLSFVARTADNGRKFQCVVTAEKGTGTWSATGGGTVTVGNYQPIPNGTENSNPATLTVT